MYIFFNIINAFTVTFYQCNASLLKSNNFVPKNLADCCTFEW